MEQWFRPREFASQLKYLDVESIGAAGEPQVVKQSWWIPAGRRFPERKGHRATKTTSSTREPF
jgi:hypothetical protein